MQILKKLLVLLTLIALLEGMRWPCMHPEKTQPSVGVSLQKVPFNFMDQFALSLTFNNPMPKVINLDRMRPGRVDFFGYCSEPDEGIEFTCSDQRVVPILETKPARLQGNVWLCVPCEKFEIPAFGKRRHTIDLRAFLRFPGPGSFRVKYRIRIPYVFSVQRNVRWSEMTASVETKKSRYLKRIFGLCFFQGKNDFFLSVVENSPIRFFEARGELPLITIKGEGKKKGAFFP